MSSQAPTISQMSSTKAILAATNSIQEIKDIRDKAEALRQYCKKAHDGLQRQNQAAEIKIRAERRAGELLAAMEKNQGGWRQRESCSTTMVEQDDPPPRLQDLGINHNQSSRWQRIARIPEGEFETYILEIRKSDRELTTQGVLERGKLLERKAERSRRREKAQREGALILPPDRIQIRHGDFRKVLGDVQDESVDLLLTDPLYDQASLNLWTDLSRFSERVLRPGKLLVALSGQMYLPQVIENLGSSLTYLWTGALLFRGRHNTVYQVWMKSYWKPILFFSKGKYQPVRDHWPKDVIDGDGMEKGSHDFQQGVNESRYLIEKLSYEGNLILDPFLGSGTNALAAYSLNRRFIGSDIDDYAVNETKRRLGLILDKKAS